MKAELKTIDVILIRSRAIDPGIHKIVHTLHANGYKVKVLIWDREGKRAIKDPGYSITYFRLKAPYDRITVVFYLPLWWLHEFLFLMFNKTKIIHASDLDTLLPALLIKLIRRVKLFYTIYDFYADNLPRSLPLFLKKLVMFIEKFGIGMADALFLVDHSRYRQIRGTRINTLSFIYNSPPDYKANYNVKLDQTRTSSDLTLFYAGLIHRSRGLMNVIAAIKDIDRVRLIIAGTGPDVKALENLPASLKNKIKFLGFIPYDEVIKNSLEADVLFALYDPRIPGNRYASPNKLFEAMMCSKPIIVNKETTAAKIVEKERCGLIVPYDDIESIKKAILSLRDNPELRFTLGKNGRIAYEKRYNWKLMEKKLLNVYNQTLKLDVG